MCVGTTGMPLLQLAVRSQRIDLVHTLLDWGEEHSESVRRPNRRSMRRLTVPPASCGGMKSAGGWTLPPSTPHS